MHFQMITHEGVIDKSVYPTLQGGIADIYGRTFNAPVADVSVEVNEIPAGRFYTAGQLSKSSIVAGPVPTGTAQETRVKFMDAICDLWCDATSCSPNEIVVSAPDA